MLLMTPKTAVSLALLIACNASLAIHPGISPNAPTVINPFNNQATQLWKLVGTSNGCTAYLITPQWTLSANHCRAGANVSGDPSSTTHHFRNDHISSAIDPLRVGETVNGVPTCEQVPTRDFWLCRLQTPANFPVPFTFPPLVAGPTAEALLTTLPGLGENLGSLMMYGRSGLAPNRIGFRTFSGTPWNYSPISDATGATIPVLDAGDSGGAMFWFSPTGQAAIVGTTVTPVQFFTEADITWIRNKIAAYGDTPPSTVTIAQHLGGPLVPPAMDLPNKPTSVRFTNGGLKLAWTPPADSSVTSYRITWGIPMQATPSLNTVPAPASSTTVTAALNTLATVCVQPVNAAAPANLAYVAKLHTAPTPLPPGWVPPTVQPNCNTFDLRATQSVVTGITASAIVISNSLSSVTFNWPATTPIPADLPINRFVVTSTVTYPYGLVRTSPEQTLSQRSLSLNAARGTKVCLKVFAMTDGGVTGTSAAQHCITAP